MSNPVVNAYPAHMQDRRGGFKKMSDMIWLVVQFSPVQRGHFLQWFYGLQTGVQALDASELKAPATGMMSSLAQPRAMSVKSSVRVQQSCLLKPFIASGRCTFRREAPLRRQSTVRAEQKENGKDSKADKEVSKLVKGQKRLSSIPN